ncbi:hypothetical protein DGWBC_1757 [Dehalogenimonas sp. WBC-2]|nr:hypothetical protein DGWBC_1757 [Dehalogenimonas sp. WBC-2]
MNSTPASVAFSIGKGLGSILIIMFKLPKRMTPLVIVETST